MAACIRTLLLTAALLVATVLVAYELWRTRARVTFAAATSSTLAPFASQTNPAGLRSTKDWGCS